MFKRILFSIYFLPCDVGPQMENTTKYTFAFVTIDLLKASFA